MAFWDILEQYDINTALVMENGNSLSYKELLDISDKIGLCFERRCLVFSICSNCAESVAGYLGFLRHRIVPLLLPKQTTSELLERLLQTYRPSYIFFPKKHNLAICGNIVWSGESYILLKLNFNQDYKLADELAVLLTTSGSTGSPKLVRQSVKNIEANTRSIVEYLHITEKDRAITTLPMSYTYGLSIIQTHLAQGAAIILTEASLLEKRFWNLFKAQYATTFGGVPYTYEILKKLNFKKMELPSLRYITQAGGKLSKELSKEFLEICKYKGIEMIVMYGQTEATARMSYLPWKFAQSKAGSIGIAVPNGHFWLADESGKTIEEPEMTGELIYCGENVTLGYAQNCADLAKEDENHGELQTGDMAKRDADGFYYIVGRKKRFLKIFGNRVNMDEVENMLKQEGFDCACTGVDDQMNIYVTDATLLEKVATFIRDHTSINRNGFKVCFIEKIPRNEAGKIIYSRLKLYDEND